MEAATTSARVGRGAAAAITSRAGAKPLKYASTTLAPVCHLPHAARSIRHLKNTVHNRLPRAPWPRGARKTAPSHGRHDDR